MSPEKRLGVTVVSTVWSNVSLRIIVVVVTEPQSISFHTTTNLGSPSVTEACSRHLPEEETGPASREGKQRGRAEYPGPAGRWRPVFSPQDGVGLSRSPRRPRPPQGTHLHTHTHTHTHTRLSSCPAHSGVGKSSRGKDVLCPVSPSMWQSPALHLLAKVFSLSCFRITVKAAHNTCLVG